MGKQFNEKLLDIQSKLKAPKNQYNSFGKYHYRSCEDVLEALKPILVEHKCLLTITDEVVMIGSRYYIKATATISDGEDYSVIYKVSVELDELIAQYYARAAKIKNK